MRVPAHLKNEWRMVACIGLFICAITMVCTEIFAIVAAFFTYVQSNAEWNDALAVLAWFNVAGLLICAVITVLFALGPIFTCIKILLSSPADQRYSCLAVLDGLPEEWQSFLSKTGDMLGTAHSGAVPAYAIGQEEVMNVVNQVAELNTRADSGHNHDGLPHGSLNDHQHDGRGCAGHGGHQQSGRKHYACSMQIPLEVWVEAADRKDSQFKALYEASQNLPASDYLMLVAEIAKGYSKITLGHGRDPGQYRSKAVPYCEEVLQKIDSIPNVSWSERLFILYDLALVSSEVGQSALACRFYEKLLPLARERLGNKAALGSILSNYRAEAKAAKNEQLALSLKKEANSFLQKAESGFFDRYVIAG